MLKDREDGVEPEAVHASVEPETRHVPDRALDLGVAPVEVRLLLEVEVIIVLAGRRVDSQADPPKTETQLLGGPSSLPSRQIYQSRLGLSRLERDSRNQGCCSDV